MATAVPFQLPGGLTLFSDGSFVRSGPLEIVPANSNFVHGVASKDIVVVPEKGLWMRLFLPQVALTRGATLPIVVYFHGSGFVSVSAGDPMYDDYCRRLAHGGQVVVISVEYRKAPEHRLPAAFDDGFEAMEWLQCEAVSLQEPWLKSYADYSLCFLMGHSAGGSIAYQVALRMCERNMDPLTLVGLILDVPGFGGEARTLSEIELGGEGAALTLPQSDLLWFFSLPEGSNRDHPYCNVLSPQAPKLKKDSAPPVKIIAGELDLLRDKQIEFANALKSVGIAVLLDVIKDGEHDMWVKAQADLEFQSALSFINAHSSRPQEAKLE